MNYAYSKFFTEEVHLGHFLCKGPKIHFTLFKKEVNQNTQKYAEICMEP